MVNCVLQNLNLDDLAIKKIDAAINECLDKLSDRFYKHTDSLKPSQEKLIKLLKTDLEKTRGKRQ